MKSFVESPLARNLLAPRQEDNPSLAELNRMTKRKKKKIPPVEPHHKEKGRLIYKGLDAIADVVLAYRPKSKRKKPRKRKKVKRGK